MPWTLHPSPARRANVMCLAGVMLLVVASSSQRVLAGEPSTASRPNIVLIVVDDLGYGELGCQGNAEIPTPHIDSIAEHGVRFTAGYATASYCSPSRAALVTGRYQTRFGHELNPTGEANLQPSAALPLTERTLAEQLREAGYATALVGKWHLGGTRESHPLARGFDEFYGFTHEGHFYKAKPYEGLISFLRRADLPAEAEDARWRDGDIIYSAHLRTNEPPYDAHNPLQRGRKEIIEPEYLTDALSREAAAFIERQRAEPFFLYLAYNAVHSPMQARQEDLTRFSHIDDMHRRIFAAMLARLDDGVGRVLGALRKAELEENTLVFFLSDNGGPTAELTSSNAPLRGGKGALYEGGLRVPFLMQWKGTIEASRVMEQPVLTTDVFVTASAAAGAPLPAGTTYDGVNLLPYLGGQRQEPPHETIYWRMGPKAALRRGDWKLVREPARRGKEAAWELYDVRGDLGEARDLAHEQPEVLAEMVADWERLDAEMAPPNWVRER